MRLTSELAAAAISDPHVLCDGSFPYWIAYKHQVNRPLYPPKNPVPSDGSFPYWIDHEHRVNKSFPPK